MGRGVIKENLGEGLYRVEVDLDTSRIVRRREELQRQLDQLDIDITAQETTVADLEDAWQADQEDAEKLVALMSARSELAHMHARRAAARSALETLEGANVQDYQLDLWCADYTIDLDVGKYVGVAEVPGELRFINVRPAYDGRANYTQARDGAMNPALNLPPASAVLYWALRPSWQKYHPTYRYGTLTAVDTVADIATVDLAPMKSSDQSVDVNLETTLTDIPVFYMDCNAAVFEAGDEVLVEFPNLDWPSARVAGFRRNPKPCRVCDYIRFKVNGRVLSQQWKRARIMDAETGQFIIPPAYTYPEMYVENGLLDVRALELNGNQYVDYGAHRFVYSESLDQYFYVNTKDWYHNAEVFPVRIVAGDELTELTSDDYIVEAPSGVNNTDFPDLAPGAAGRIVRAYCNVFSSNAYINGWLIEPGQMRSFLWTGTEWIRHGDREPNTIQWRIAQLETGGLFNYCGEGVATPIVDHIFIYNSALFLGESYIKDRMTAQVNWILHPDLLADAVITEEEIGGETVRVATLDYVAKRLNRYNERGLVCDKNDTALATEFNTAIQSENEYLTYTSYAGGVSGNSSIVSTDLGDTQGWYNYKAYCNVSEGPGCFGWYLDSHDLNVAGGIEQLVILSDWLGRNPSYSEATFTNGIVYGTAGESETDPDVYEYISPKERATFTMVDA